MLAKWYIIVSDNELLYLCFGWGILLSVMLLIIVVWLFSRLILFK